MLLDFFFKKISFYISFFFFYTTNIILSEKYLVEYFSFRVSKFLAYINIYTDYFNNEAVYSVLSVIILIVIIFFAIILNVKLT
jgi:hypothetical protein